MNAVRSEGLKISERCSVLDAMKILLDSTGKLLLVPHPVS